MMHVKLDELRGRKVFDANGREIGRVRAALVDMETWQVDTMSVGVSRHAAADLDLPWSFPWSFFRPPTVNLPTGQINAAGDAIILRVSLGELREATPHMIGALASVH
jgi:sporulation protein YlmC with PRC-barrel domain